MPLRNKTVLLVRNAAYRDFGGAETYPVSLATILQKEGYHPIIVTRSKKLLDYASTKSVNIIKGWWWSRQNWSGKRIALIPLYLMWQFGLMLWYITLILRTKASVLHLQSKDDFIAGTIAGRLLNRKVVWTDHMDLRYVFQNISKPFRNPVGKLVFWAAHFAHHVILISENERRLVTSHFKKEALKKQLILIRNGVVDKGTASRNNPSDSFVFCLASRLVINKGIGEAIKAFQKLQNDVHLSKRNIRLAIYGDGPDRQTFQQLARNNAAIKFYGHQENAIERVRNADVFVLPSYQEGLSIALLEATMLGKAIIASNIDSNPEIVTNGKTGLLVKVRDIESLRAAMYKLVTDDILRHSLEIAARNNYEENFNLATITKKEIIPIYNG